MNKQNKSCKIFGEYLWIVFCANESIPFEKPANKGKSAVKVINHFGDEVLKVYEV